MTVTLVEFAAAGALIANYYGLPIGNLGPTPLAIPKGIETSLGALLGSLGGSILKNDGVKNILDDKEVYKTALLFGLTATIADLLVPDNQMIQLLLVLIIPMIILKEKGKE